MSWQGLRKRLRRRTLLYAAQGSAAPNAARRQKDHVNNPGKCSLCGYEFEEEESPLACRGCPLTKGCRLIKCPHCGYEVPPEPRWLKRLRGGDVQRKRKSSGSAESAV